MSEEHMSGSKTPKILGAVIAIAAVVGLVGWFANRGVTDATTLTTTNTGKLQTTGTDPKNEVTTTTTTSTKTTETGASGTVTDTTITTTPVTETTTAGTSSTYKDGTYSATGSYTSPAGGETVDVSLTLKDDVIVAATFKGNATNPGSKMWQGKFGEGYQSVVVGKSISELALTVVNGSSLTPKGFMDAVADIKAEAHS